MGHYYLKLPKMGESVAEATVTKWLKDVGDPVSLDDPILEIATDKVDTDVTSEVEGVILEKKFKENEVVQVGEVLVVIETKGDEKESIDTSKIEVLVPESSTYGNDDSESVVTKLEEEIQIIETTVNKTIGNSERFLFTIS
jgi:2-oxoglutarate dehydrogenase E2 component (dihydrolipoamide succinyltransferase)